MVQSTGTRSSAIRMLAFWPPSTGQCGWLWCQGARSGTPGSLVRTCSWKKWVVISSDADAKILSMTKMVVEGNANNAGGRHALCLTTLPEGLTPAQGQES